MSVSQNDTVSLTQEFLSRIRNIGSKIVRIAATTSGRTGPGDASPTRGFRSFTFWFGLTDACQVFNYRTGPISWVTKRCVNL
jgi:hypothetical protein